jgi:hypothetical protein
VPEVVRVYPSVALKTLCLETVEEANSVGGIAAIATHACVFLLLMGSFNYVSKQNFDRSVVKNVV